MKVRLLIPRRSDGGERDEIWERCREYWLSQRPEWELREGAHEHGHFNRSAAINAAAGGEWEVAVILDADTIVDCPQVEAAIAQSVRTGRLTLGFDVRCLLSAHGTRKILDGAKGAWDRWVKARQVPRDAYEFVSGCVVVPRALWDAVGGFDERFEGWGGEDDAFHAACMAIAGVDPRTERIKGNAWHLYHAPSPAASQTTTTWKQAKHLSDRYIAASWDREEMEALLAEDRGDDQIVVVCLTTGDRSTLHETLQSFEERVTGPIGRRLICVDAEESKVERPGWDVVHMGKSAGYTTATRRAHEFAVGSGQPWVSWLEDDFTFNESIDMSAMQAILEAHPLMVQISLMRQAWYPEEVEAGGVIAYKPDAFVQREGFVEHRDYWTTNPMLTRRAFMAENEWPDRLDSERRFGRQVFRNPDVYAGILGEINDSPRVTHIGADRAGHGY